MSETTRFDYLIIGGGITGVTAAEAVVASDPDARVGIFGAEPHIVYSRVILPRYVEAKMERAKVFLRKDGQLEEKGITYIRGKAVVSVDTVSKHVILADDARIEYGKLLIATGGEARRLPCPGGDDPDIDHFQTLEDAERLRTAKGRDAAVIGSGFIALELIMAYSRLGLTPHAFVRHDGLFSRILDKESRSRVLEALKKNGVDVRTHTETKRITRVEQGYELKFVDGSSLVCARVGVGVGLKMNIGFLEDSGIETNDGVIVDEQLRASATDVFAAGDVAEFPDVIAGRRHTVGTWQNALFQGKLVARNMLGGKETYDQVTSYSINCFDLPLAFVGTVDGLMDTRIVQVTDSSVLQLCLLEDRIVGATCVGKFSARAEVQRAITTRQKLTKEQCQAFVQGTAIS